MTDNWRFIDTGPCSAFYNMALDEAIATTVRKGSTPPTLRLYGWDIPSVSIGYFQRISDINIDYCIKRGIPIVRRPTGGRAILHNHEITYSFSVKTTHGVFSKGLLDSYKRISTAFVLALSKIGISPELRLYRIHSKSPLCFESVSYGEITLNDKKIIGSAQKRWSDGLLQQGSIPYVVDRNETVKVFRLESSEGEGKLIGLKEIALHINLEDLRNAIKGSFEDTFNIKLISSVPSQEEISLTLELEAEKYLSPHWNFKR
jgi:lipoate-protein ligase A